MEKETPDVQAGFRKGRGSKHHIAMHNREFEGKCFIDYTKAFECVDNGSYGWL